VCFVTSGAALEAFRAEAQSLSEAVAREAGAALGRPSQCPPWTVGDLLYHVRISVGRLTSMLTEPEPEPEPEPDGAGPDGGRLLSAADYYRPDQRFSPATNADRVAAAQRGAAGLPAGTLAADFDQAWREAWALVRSAPPGRVVRTRHGDRMRLAEFLRTRVVELAVHGLDLAMGLGREPWLTPQAAGVVEGLMLSPAAAAVIRRDLGWDQASLIAKITGRSPLTPAEQAHVEHLGIRWLALG
jgi:uncharacterized protein (TIGR03083 family)